MSINFPIIYKRTRFGVIPDAIIRVEVLTKFGYQAMQFIFDTGADFTMLPHHMAELMGIDLKHCPQGISYGIEGHGVRIFMSPIQVKIGHVDCKVRCLFSEKEDTPYLLGRADILSLFKFTYDFSEKKIKFTKVSS